MNFAFIKKDLSKTAWIVLGILFALFLGLLVDAIYSIYNASVWRGIKERISINHTLFRDGSVISGTVKVRNPNAEYEVHNLVVRCDFYSETDTLLDSNKFTIYRKLIPYIRHVEEIKTYSSKAQYVSVVKCKPEDFRYEKVKFDSYPSQIQKNIRAGMEAYRAE